MSFEIKAIQQFLDKTRQRGEPVPLACCCLGPQGNDPACPCGMLWIVAINNIWFRITKVETIVGYSATEIGSIHDDYSAKRMEEYRKAHEENEIKEQQIRKRQAQSNFAKFDQLAINLSELENLDRMEIGQIT